MIHPGVEEGRELVGGRRMAAMRWVEKPVTRSTAATPVVRQREEPNRPAARTPGTLAMTPARAAVAPRPGAVAMQAPRTVAPRAVAVAAAPPEAPAAAPAMTAMAVGRREAGVDG